MKYQALFSWKYKKIILKCRLPEMKVSMAKVKLQIQVHAISVKKATKIRQLLLLFPIVLHLSGILDNNQHKY